MDEIISYVCDCGAEYTTEERACECDCVPQIKALDFVLTPKKQIALVTESNYNGSSLSIRIIGENIKRERTAWYDSDELTFIDNLALLLAKELCHPFGSGAQDAKHFYGSDKE